MVMLRSREGEVQAVKIAEKDVTAIDEVIGDAPATSVPVDEGGGLRSWSSVMGARRGSMVAGDDEWEDGKKRSWCMDLIKGAHWSFILEP